MRARTQYWSLFLLVGATCHCPLQSDALGSSSHRIVRPLHTPCHDGALWAKRRNKNEQARQDIDQFNRWYDRVDDDATPDNVFWDEMERQRMWSPSSSSSNTGSSNLSSNPPSSTPSSSSPASSSSSSSSSDLLDKYPGIFTSPNLMGSNKVDVPGIAEERSVEATLASFAQFMVPDNWLDEKYLEFHGDRNLWGKEEDLEEQNSQLDQEMDDWMEDESSRDSQDLGEQEDSVDDTNIKQKMNMFAKSNEPWDYYERELHRKQGKNKSGKNSMVSSKNTNMDDDDDVDDDDEEEDASDDWKIRVDPDKANHPMAKQFIVHLNDNDESQTTDDGMNTPPDYIWEQAREEAEHLSRIAKIRLHSARLENAKWNPKARTFFSRPPNSIEGYERMWVSAIDNCCMPNLVGSFRNYGIEFADNFGDWADGCEQDRFCSIEDIASYKARMVYQVTGLPCIASRTSFEVEPVPVPSGIDARQLPSRAYINPRVTSGYRFNDVGDHVDYIVEALKLFSDPSRVTRFRSCFCFYDGEMEIFDYGELDCDLYFSNSLRTYIPMSHGINEMCKTLQLTFGLEYQTWLRAKVREALGAGENKASMKLRDRVLKEAKVLPNDIIDVSAFMDSQVDVALMDECGKELSQRFEKMKPTKILTVATTGLVIAIPMAKYLQVPVVYARKERNVVMSNTFQATYSSKTVGKNRELLVSKNHIDKDDRLLIIDDFLSSGSSQEALLRIVSDAGATAVGVGVLLEKVYDAGRQSLSGYNIPVHSLVRVASVADGAIVLVEEEGFSRMK